MKRYYLLCFLAALSFNSISQKVSDKQMIKAIRYGDLEYIKTNIEQENYNIHKLHKDNSNLLHHSAFYEKLDITEYLLSKNININQKDKDDFTPLIWSLHSNEYFDIAKLLIKNGADVNYHGANGVNPLRISMQLSEEDKAKDLEIFKYLIKEGANVTYVCHDCCDYTYLMFALENNKHKIAKYLIEIGADYEARDCNGCTAILHAAVKNNLELFKILHNLGANMEVKTKYEATIVDVCYRNKSWDILEYLKNEKIIDSY
jgi:uncharacterized protein